MTVLAYLLLLVCLALTPLSGMCRQKSRRRSRFSLVGRQHTEKVVPITANLLNTPIPTGVKLRKCFDGAESIDDHQSVPCRATGSPVSHLTYSLNRRESHGDGADDLESSALYSDSRSVDASASVAGDDATDRSTLDVNTPGQAMSASLTTPFLFPTRVEVLGTRSLTELAAAMHGPDSMSTTPAPTEAAGSEAIVPMKPSSGRDLYRNMKIVFVDDDPPNQRVGVRFLKMIGVQQDNIFVLKDGTTPLCSLGLSLAPSLGSLCSQARQPWNSCLHANRPLQ